MGRWEKWNRELHEPLKTQAPHARTCVLSG